MSVSIPPVQAHLVKTCSCRADSGVRFGLRANAARFHTLSAATRAPGAFIHRTKGGDPFGIVAPGQRADLILSEKNPLASLSTLRTPMGVMVKGQWRDAAALKALTDNIRQGYRRASEMP